MINNINQDVINKVYNFSDMTNEELRCKFFQKLQECINLCNNSSDILDWIKNEGLENKVNEILFVPALSTISTSAPYSVVATKPVASDNCR